MTKIRLDRLLSNLGYGSRKDVGLLIKSGDVALNGVILPKVDQSINLVDTRNGVLTVYGEPIDPPSPFTVMLNKPVGYICSHDEKGLLVYDLLPERWKIRKPALSCAGRLDKESTGQVILTDNGELLHRITHPKSHARKYYTVIVENNLRGDEAILFASGDFLMKGDDKLLKPAYWKETGDKSGTILLQEGRFHQIRRMFETLGNRVVMLHRYQTGGLKLAGLDLGQYKILPDNEIEKIFSTEPIF